MAKINKLNEALAEKKSALASKIEEVRAGAENDATAVEDVQSGLTEVKQLKADIEALSDQIKTLSEALDLPAEQEAEEPAKDAEKAPEEPETAPEEDKEEKREEEDIPDDDDSELPDEEMNSADKKKKEETRSAQDLGELNMQAKVQDNISAFKAFLATGEVRDGLTTVEGSAVIPHEILDVQKTPNDPAQLASYVNRQQVNSGSGTLPVLAKNQARLVSASELAENPELANISLKGVDYKAKTLRGVLPVSMEMLQDAPEIEQVVAEYVSEAKSLTEQYKVGEVLQKATAVAVSDVDGVKDAFNRGLSNYTNKSFVVSESFFAEVDKLKDLDGRYLLQDSISAPSGKQLLGAPVIVVADEVLGKAGEAHAFVGDLKAFVVEALRSDIQISWQDDDLYGKKLMAAIRADFQVADSQAGKFLTFTPTPAPASAK
ncbi:phage major capsid protein [Weissella hellenica]|uniref:phage major capsid protein n=1 Tax=Weissella hellenica TaxID=46256 RepID=UPI00388B1C32